MEIRKKTLAIHWPFVSTIPEHTNLLSILSTNENALVWFYNHLIQIFVNRNAEISLNLNYCYGDNYSLLKNCPFLDCYSISREIITQKWQSIKEFIVDSIRNDYYAYLSVDVFEINNYQEYNKKHFNHDLFIYGYDLDRNIFNIADFFRNGKYSQEDGLMEQIENGYYNYNNQTKWGFDNVYMIKINKNYKYTFDIELAIDLLNDYVLSENSIKYFRPISKTEFSKKNSYAFGVEAYNVLNNYISYVSKNNQFISVRSFHILYAHKLTIMELLNHLDKEGYLVHSNDHIKDYEKIVKKIFDLRNVIIKYNIRKNLKVINSIKRSIHEAKHMEENLLKKIITDIRILPQVNIPEDTIIPAKSNSIKYTGAWKRTGNTFLTYQKGSSASLIFIGTSISYIADKNEDGGLVDIYLDRSRVHRVDLFNMPALNNQVIYTAENLSYGYHLIEIFNSNDTGQSNVNAFICKTDLQNNLEIHNNVIHKSTDLISQGTWITQYGKDGYDIFCYKSNIPNYVRIVYHDFYDKIWYGPGIKTSISALQTLENEDRLAACRFFHDNARIDIVVPSSTPVLMSIYIMECYHFERMFKIIAKNGDSNEVLDERIINVLDNGTYETYKVQGHIILEFENIGSPIGVISAIFWNSMPL